MVPEIEVLPVREEDEPFLAALFAEVHAEILLPAALPAAMAEQLLTMQYRGQKMSYLAQFPQGESSILWLGGERIGRLFLNESATELRVVDIALAAPYRGRGFGKRLLEDVGKRARARAVPVRLSLRAGSPAARLYQRVGFVTTSMTATHVEMEWDVTGRIFEPERKNAEEDSREDNAVPRLEATSAAFQSLLGLHLRAELDSTVDATLRVIAVQPIAARQTDIAANDSFTVTLAGPIDAVLPSSTYSLTYGNSPALTIFLSPVGPRVDEMEYEAVFNRMAPA